MHLTQYLTVITTSLAISAVAAPVFITCRDAEADPSLNAGYTQHVCKREAEANARADADPDPVLIACKREAEASLNAGYSQCLGRRDADPVLIVCKREAEAALNAGYSQCIARREAEAEAALNAGGYKQIINAREPEADPALNAGKVPPIGYGESFVPVQPAAPAKEKRSALKERDADAEASLNAGYKESFVPVVAREAEAEAEPLLIACKRTIFDKIFRRALNAGCYYSGGPVVAKREAEAEAEPQVLVACKRSFLDRLFRRALNASCLPPSGGPVVAKREAEANPALNAGGYTQVVNVRDAEAQPDIVCKREPALQAVSPCPRGVVCKREPALQAVGPCPGPSEYKREADPALNAGGYKQIINARDAEADPALNAGGYKQIINARSAEAEAEPSLNAGTIICHTSPCPGDPAQPYKNKRAANAAINAGHLGYSEAVAKRALNAGYGQAVARDAEPEPEPEALIKPCKRALNAGYLPVYSC